MAGFKVEITGLKELGEKLSDKSIKSALLPAINKSLLKIHSGLKTEVGFQYAFSNRNLNQVLVGKSTSSAKFASNVLSEGNLEYNNVQIRLVDFPHDVIEHDTLSFFDVLTKKGKFRTIATKTSYQATVKVKREGGFKPVFKTYGAFYQKADSSGLDKYTGLRKPINKRSNIYIRKFSDTWITRPSKAVGMAVRTPVRVLYGPSMAQAAKTIYNSAKFQKQIIPEVEQEIRTILDSL